MDTSSLILRYFQLGLSYAEIHAQLVLNHDESLSFRTFRRRLNEMGLGRRTNYSPEDVVVEFIRREVDNGSQHGYRWLWLKCLQKGLVVQKETVRRILGIVDPEGVERRLRQRLRRRQYYALGPNYIWHVDGYDKLKPYGICISGAIDGYSRHIIWLEAYTTNNDPAVIAGYFFKSLIELDGVPHRIRSDFGTENTTMRRIQLALRQQDESSFLLGRSTQNTRIESWWNILRRESADDYIHLFSRLKDEGYYTGNPLDKNVLQFVFMPMIKVELQEVVQVWNCHIIRPSTNDRSPSGRPMTMYTMPVLSGSTEHKEVLDYNIAEQYMESASFHNEDDVCDSDLRDLCELIMDEHGWVRPISKNDGLMLYLNLRQDILELAPCAPFIANVNA